MNRLDVIDREASRFADVLAAADSAARVPTCPEWDAADLMWHLTYVHLFWAAVLARNPQDDEIEAIEEGAPARPDTIAQMLPIRERATADLLAQLRALDDREPRWSWFDPDRTVGFTRRMQTYEATMHRVDAELTAGLTPSSIAPELAAGAVEHCVDVMWAGWLPAWATYEPITHVEIRSTDTAQSWLVEIGHWTGTGPESGTSFDEPRALRGSPGATPTAVVSGTAEQLARWAWSRQPDEDAISVEGTDDGRAAVARLIAAGIQ